MKKLFIILSLLFAAPAWGADSLCAVDTDRNGSVDTWCSGPDADNDGYTTSGSGNYTGYTGKDCDDNDFQIYPGVATGKGCSAGQWHTCQADGTYTACSASTYCGATGGGVCKYVDPVNGNDTTGTGAVDAPWKSFKAISYGCGSNCYSLNAGDMVIVRAGTVSTFVDAQNSLLYARTRRGTTENPIVIRNYPGESVLLQSTLTGSDTEQAQIHLYQANGYVFDGLNMTGGYGVGIAFNSTDEAPTIQQSEVRNCNFYDLAGNSSTNVAAVSVGGSTNVKVHHNKFYNIKDISGTGLQESNAVIAFLGSGLEVRHNQIGSDQTTVTKMKGLGYKHGSATGNWLVYGNSIWGVYDKHAVWTAMANSTIQHNRFLDGGVVLKGDPGGPSYIQNEVISNNTFINSKAMLIFDSMYELDGSGAVSVTNNVVVDNTSPYNFAYGGLVQVDYYASADSYTTWVTGGLFTFNNNCYYNASESALTYGFQMMNGGGTGGSIENFAGWKSTYGFDANSYNEDPSLDSSQIATSANCKDKGWRIATTAPKHFLPGRGNILLLPLILR